MASYLSAIPLPSLGYLCLTLALLARSSRQSAILDLGYTDRRDLGHRDVRETGYSDVRDKQLLHDGSRMKRLLKISRRLDIVSSLRTANTESRLSDHVVEELSRGISQLINALSDPPVRTHTDVDEDQKVKRGPQTDIVSAVRSRYIDYYAVLADFCDQLPSKLKASAPEGLQNVVALKSIMPTDDHVFSEGDERLFTSKFFTIQVLLDSVFANTLQFFKESASGWYWNQWMITNVKSGLVKAELNKWQTIPTDGSKIAIEMDAGVGGVNSGVRNDMSVDALEQLAGLINTLNVLHVFRNHYMNFYNKLMQMFKRIPLPVSDKHTFENYFSPDDPAFDGDIAKVREKYQKIRIWLALVVLLEPEFDEHKETIREIINDMDAKYENLLQDGYSERESEVLAAGVGGTNAGSDFQQLDRVLAERKVDAIYHQYQYLGRR